MSSPPPPRADIRDATQKLHGFIRLEVANGRSREIHNVSRRFVTGRRQHYRLQVVRAYRQNFQVWKNFLEKSSRLAQLLFRDIDWDINGRILESLDQNPRFRAGAGAQSDEFEVRSEL